MQHTGASLFIIILLGFFLMTMMTAFIVIMVIYHRHRQIKNQQRVEAMEAEYDKTILHVEKEIRENTLTFVGRELHDNIGQLLSLAKMNLLSSKPEKNQYGKLLINEIIREVRILSKSLNLEWVESITIEDFIQGELRKLEQAEFCKVSYLKKGQDLIIEKEKKLVLMRIVQECLNNAIKHSQANLIEIEVDSTSEQNTIFIKDDGKGFDVTAASDGIGLLNLRSRTSTIGGEIVINSKLGGGTEIFLKLPK